MVIQYNVAAVITATGGKRIKQGLTQEGHIPGTPAMKNEDTAKRLF